MMGGGVEATVMNHYRHIDRSQVQFDFIVQTDSTVVPKDEIESLGGRVFYVPPYSNPVKYVNACRQLFQQIHPRIVHSHMNAVSVFTLMAAKQAGVPVRIAHSHSTSNPNEKAKTLVKNVLRPFSKVYPTHLAACSEYAARWLFGDQVVDAKQVHIIHNAIDIDRFTFNSQSRAIKRDELGVGDSQLLIGQVGRICFQKNQTFTIKVFSELLKNNPSAVLAIVGDGDDSELRKEIHDLRIERNVKLLGIRDDVADYYSAFGIFLFRQSISGISDELIEAAKLDGASETRIFHSIILPMSHNTIAALAIFTFLWNWEDYLWPFLMITDENKQLLAVGLKAFNGQYGTDYGGLFAATSLAIVPVIIVYMIFQKQFIAGIATGSGK